MKIGFYGDSFCMEMSNPHSLWYKYDTYLTMIKNHYSADIVHLGQGGSSIWDVILKQFPSCRNNLPDVCVFVWTDYARLYHPVVRDLTASNVLDQKFKDIKLTNITHPFVISAAKAYFKNLYDAEKSQAEAKAAMMYFDETILSTIPNTTKIIHLASFDHIHKWKHGVTIDTPLNYITSKIDELPNEGMGPNHLGNYNKNLAAFDLIKPSLD